MLLIYTHKITSRFSYIMRQVFTRMLGIEISFTTTVEDFIKHSGPKITYTKQPLQNEFFVRSNDLLFEQGINDLQINVENWEGVPAFFRAGDRSNLPYDIFAASFFLLSRYEEYIPHLKDHHGRFPFKESIAYRHQFLEVPVVDIWAKRLISQLHLRFPNLEFSPRKYRYTSVIDITSSHCFAYRGLVRGAAGMALDLLTLRLRRVGKRMVVWLDPKKDPYDNFDELIALHKKHNIQSIFFFQFANYSTYDKNVSPNNNKFKYLIKSVADYSKVSLSASYSSFNDTDLLIQEKKRLSSVLNRPVNDSKLRYNRVDIPKTYRDLVAAEFTNDYTMGYTHATGFRAGTCTPFYFYDIPQEVQQPIKIHPFAVQDYALVPEQKEEEMLAKIAVLYNQVKQVNGHFITVFSNELLGGSHRVNWLKLYSKVIDKFHV